MGWKEIVIRVIHIVVNLAIQHPRNYFTIIMVLEQHPKNYLIIIQVR